MMTKSIRINNKAFQAEVRSAFLYDDIWFVIDSGYEKETQAFLDLFHEAVSRYSREIEQVWFRIQLKDCILQAFDNKDVECTHVEVCDAYDWLMSQIRE